MHRHTSVLLFVVLIAGVSQANADWGKDYDYFLLVRQWGVSFCETFKCAHRPEPRFTIHGLWPERFDGHWPECCNSNYPFRFEKLVPVIKDMLYNWFSYSYGISQQCSWGNLLEKTNGEAVQQTDKARRLLLAEANVTLQNGGGGSPDYQFWKHEWEKHGTCALDVFDSELDYFKRVLDLHDKYNIDAAFKKQGIVPSDRDYKTKRLIRALEDEFGYKPWFACKNGELSEIRVCIDKKLRAFDCPIPGSTNYGCPNRVLLPDRRN